MYKLKLFKFFYELLYDLLPPYFNHYIKIIEQKPVRDLRYQYMHTPLVKRVYAECSTLFQLIKLINSLKNDSNDTILEKIAKRVIHIQGWLMACTTDGICHRYLPVNTRMDNTPKSGVYRHLLAYINISLISLQIIFLTVLATHYIVYGYHSTIFAAYA